VLVHSLFNQDYPSVDIYHERERERAKDFNGNITTSNVIAKKRIVGFFFHFKELIADSRPWLGLSVRDICNEMLQK